MTCPYGKEDCNNHRVDGEQGYLCYYSYIKFCNDPDNPELYTTALSQIKTKERV